MDYKQIERVFNQYVSKYNADDPKIKLKTDHTYRVAHLASLIAKASGADESLAWLSGMLHDIGRFEQVKRYNTFSDAFSVDHAVFGADLLFSEGLIEYFDLNLDKEELLILEKSIRHHSAYRLPEDLSDKERQYCNTLRDADKIDIFRVHCETPLEEIYNVTESELRSSEVSNEVKQAFMNRTAVLKSWKKTPADNVVSLVCLAFELVYPISRQITRDQGYLDRILDFKSDNTETVQWFQYMKEKIKFVTVL